MTVLEVAVCAPVRQTYTYSNPHHESADRSGSPDLVGKRVVVPFGARRITGYVLAEREEHGENGDFTIKPVTEVIDSKRLFPDELIGLFRWVADYYHYPLGLVIKSALPSGMSAAPQKTIVLLENGKDCDDHAIPDSISGTDWFARLLRDGEISGRSVQTLLAKKKLRKDVELLEAGGIVQVVTELKRDKVSSKLERCYLLEPVIEQQVREWGEEAETTGNGWPQRTMRKAEVKSLRLLENLAREIDGKDGVPRREFIARYPYGAKAIKGLIEDGLVIENTRRIYRTPFGELLPYYSRPDELSVEQVAALAQIHAAMDDARYQPFLLHGVTGSGKTEVYLRAAEKALEKGRSVLVLVPEIALATQIEAHFISRFRDKVALLHSGLSPGERFDEWWRILNGDATIVIGARSAVFAPVCDIGLIVVDEEHDASFKQADRLRYNGRDLALVRGKQCGCTVILGSATPSVTSYHHSRTGKFRLVELTRRIGDRKLPEAVLVDLKEAAGNGRKAVPLFHQTLRTALETNLQQNHQSILLLNRRGFSTSVICKSCGAFVECNHCKVTLNLHKQKNVLLCHYCGFQEGADTHCRDCGSPDLHPVGFGTERVENEIGTMLPDARVARLDSDIASDRKRFLAILKEMKEGEIDILIGTQIIAKGLHFPGVTLVGVIMADSGLGFPDFRAAEKTYQLITQVTGRAGRGETGGTVIIQTMQPDHYAVALAARQGYTELIETELKIRSEIGFPPFSRLILIIIENPNNHRAQQSGIELCDGINHWCRRYDTDRTVTVLGPAPAPLEKLRDTYRWQVLLKSEHFAQLHGVTDWILTGFKTRSDTTILVDIDPENMM